MPTGYRALPLLAIRALHDRRLDGRRIAHRHWRKNRKVARGMSGDDDSSTSWVSFLVLVYSYLASMAISLFETLKALAIEFT